MKQKNNHYQAFSANWFQKNQKLLLWLFNLVYKFFPSLFFKSGERDDFKGNKIIEVGNSYATCDAGLQYFKKSDLIKTASENPANNHKDRRIYKTILRKMKQGKIKEEMKLLPARKTVFFTDWNYSKMLYNAFKPMWWAMHYWDELVADRFVPQLSFGFSTLTQYPGSIGADNPVDGSLRKYSNDTAWATIHDSATGTADKTSNPYYFCGLRTGTTSDWSTIFRSIFCFDTSSLTAGAIISATVFSAFGSLKADDNSVTPDINIYVATPANTNNLVGGDYSQIGTTAQCDTAITYLGFNDAGYNAFTFNSTGRGNVSKTGISSFGAREATHDAGDSEPTINGTNLYSYFNVYFSEDASNKPKLVVTYTIASNTGNFFLMF